MASPLSPAEALFMAALQGVTELFPISSLGHAVIVPRLLHLTLDQASASFLPFVVTLHVGTGLAALLYFWRQWGAMALSVLGRGTPAEIRRERRLLLLIVFATIPAVVLALIFEKLIRGLFAAPSIAAVFLIVNGVGLFFVERLKRRGDAKVTQTIAEMSVLDALVIGTSQALALFPGISRSGSTMAAGLLRGLNHEDTARFSFLIATPIIFAAGVHEIPKLLHGGGDMDVGLSLIAGLVSGVIAFLSIVVLMRWFKDHEIKALDPFAWYCAIAGVMSFGLMAFT